MKAILTRIFIKRGGELCIASLFLSMLTGFIVAYQYDISHPFLSSVAIDTIVPFGKFIRALHFWSSQLFFLLLIIHGIIYYSKEKDAPHWEKGIFFWLILTITIFLGVYALFSGYVLRFDHTGRDAGMIAEHLLMSVPVIGPTLNSLLLSISFHGMQRVYIVHIFFSVISWLIGTWYHPGKTMLLPAPLGALTAITVIIAVFIPAPIVPRGEMLSIVKGPWFFLGIQELLRYAPLFIAGILFPLCPIVLFWIRCLNERLRHISIFGLCLWALIYLILTVICILR